jgi:hypothetical protein
MNDIKTLADVERVLAEHGYKATLNEGSVILPIGAESSPFPCIILMDETNLTISCEIDTWGSLQDRVNPEMKEDLFLAMLDLNTQILPYAFGVLTDIDGEDDDVSAFPVVLIDSMPIGDISEEELLASMSSLLAALQTAGSLYNVSVVESL